MNNLNAPCKVTNQRKIIPQGFPYSPYFKVFVPIDTDVHIGNEVLLRHPVSETETLSICEDMITEYWIRMPNWIALDTYGVDAFTLRKEMQKKFPQMYNQDQVRILILKKK